MSTRPVEFVSEAFERILDVAAHEPDAVKAAKALSTLHRIVFLDVLPAEAVARVVRVTRDRMMDAQAPMVWQAVLDLAVATGDDELRSMVARIAAGVVRPAFSGSEDLHLWVRNAAARALGDRVVPGDPAPGGPQPADRRGACR